MKKFTALILPILLSACYYPSYETNICPEIIMPKSTIYSYQTDITDKFQVKMVSFEYYCYREESDKRYYASITPIFSVRRLESSSVTNIDANYYVKTSVNKKDYIGRRVFNQTLYIPEDVREIKIKGNPSVSRISAPPYSDFKIYIGMDLSSDNIEKSKKMFDIDYKYLTEEDIKNQHETATETVNLEILPDEEVIYSQELQKPIVVKKNRPKNNCQN